MAVINRNTLVLNRVDVVGGVVTGTLGMGFESASSKTPANLTMTFIARLPSPAPAWSCRAWCTRASG